MKTQVFVLYVDLPKVPARCGPGRLALRPIHMECADITPHHWGGGGGLAGQTHLRLGGWS